MRGSGGSMEGRARAGVGSRGQRSRRGGNAANHKGLLPRESITTNARPGSISPWPRGPCCSVCNFAVRWPACGSASAACAPRAPPRRLQRLFVIARHPPCMKRLAALRASLCATSNGSRVRWPPCAPSMRHLVAGASPQRFAAGALRTRGLQRGERVAALRSAATIVLLARHASRVAARQRSAR